MKAVVIALVGFCWLALAKAAYQGRGWRPQGQTFNPTRYAQHQPQRLLAQRYGPPQESASPSGVTTAIPTTTTPTTATPTRTTPRSREPTTPTLEIRSGGSSSEDLESNPALAIANSFAFNRPIYVYNGYPLHPSLHPSLHPAALTLLH